MSLCTLYKQTSTGAIQQWTIWVEDNEILTQFGQADGKKQLASDTIKEGKNIGKSNETTPSEQAELEAKSAWEKKLKKGYVKSRKDAEAGKVDDIIEGGVSPMLAHRFDKQGHKIEFPAMVQPKLDGHRCVAVIKDGTATLWSRTRKPILGVPHIIDELEKNFGDEDIILDGELYNHDYRDRFEELTSFIKRPEPKEGHEVVQYWVYDIVSDETFYQRFHNFQERYNKIFLDPNISCAVIPVPSTRASSEKAIKIAFDSWVEVGFEGLIVRNTDSLYVNKRSYDLQKVKEFDDAEFVVTGVTEGRGKLQGKGILVCETESGEEFNCKMAGELDDLGKYLDDPDEWIGRELTIQFQGKTKNGVPRFPIGLRFRENV